MSKMDNTGLPLYDSILNDIKNRIHSSQIKATLAVNSELISLYFDIGKIILKKQKEEKWGKGVIPKLSKDLHNQLPEIKGFSERNIKFMVQFYKEYIEDEPIGKHAVSQLPWGHNILLIQKIKDRETREWYVEQTLSQGWNRNTLKNMIQSDIHKRQGEINSNFANTLEKSHSELVKENLKDPYIFDFLTLSEPFTERELEIELIKHLEKFLIELGKGFAFVGRQYHLSVSDKDYYLDLLFYHIHLRCFIVIDLKKGEFKPEYAGKMNFYCSVVDDTLKHESDKKTIGLILCQSKDKVLAEYTLRDLNKPIGISDYELTRILPKTLKSSLPSIEEIETELNTDLQT